MKEVAKKILFGIFASLILLFCSGMGRRPIEGNREGRIVFTGISKEHKYDISHDGFVVSKYDIYYDLYVMNGDGSNLRKITNDGQEKSYPIWSLDGKKIAFTRSRDDYSGIYVIDADSKREESLTDSSAYPAWSPDGKKIAFLYAIKEKKFVGICVMNITTKKIDELTHWLTYFEESPPYPFFIWSPDGKKIAYSSAFTPRGEPITDKEGYTVCKMYLINVKSKKTRRLTNFTDNINEASPEWSPDGKKILFARDDGLYLINADGTNLKVLLKKDEIKDFYYYAWSPDGNKVAFANGYLFDIKRKELKYLLEDKNMGDFRAYGKRVVWSPDGRRIALLARNLETNRDTIFTIDIDGQNLKILTTPDIDVFSFDWR